MSRPDGPEWSGDPYSAERGALVRAWRLCRAAALMVGLLVVFLHAHGRATHGALGVGIGYVALSYLLDESSRTWQRLRLTLDLLLIATVVYLDAPALQSPLRYLFVVPILDASLRLGMEELLGSATLVLLVAAGLAMRDGRPLLQPGAVSQFSVLAGGVSIASLILVLLLRDATHRRDHEGSLRRMLRRQEAVATIAAAMRQELPEETLADTVLVEALALSEGHAATLAVVDDTGHRLEPIATRTLGPEPPLHKITALDEPPLSRATVTPGEGPGSLVLVPLIGEEERLVGRVAVRSPLPPEALGEELLAALTAVGEQAGAAFEMTWLRRSLSQQSQDLNRSAGELSALVEVSRALVSRDRHDVLDEILGRAIALMAAERGSLMLIDSAEQVLRIETARGLPEDLVSATRVPVGEGFAGRVAATGEPLRLVDTLEPGVVRAGIRDALCVPLRIQDHVIGVLNVTNKSGPGHFTDRDLDVLSAMANQAAIAIQNTRLFGDLQELLLSTISTLAKAVDAKDRYTAGHSHRVTLYALEIARELEFDHEALELLKIAGLMHDVGKIGIPEKILRKPGPLTAEERQEMLRHPFYGARIVEPIKQLHPILPGVRWHHERHDGQGYPDGLAGADIPLQARVLMVADAWDAMTSDRPYRRSLDPEVALTELRSGRGTQWPPDAVDAFLVAWEAGRIQPLLGTMPEL